MSFAAKGPPRGESADGPEVFLLEENASNVGLNATSAQDKFRNPRAVREAKLELLREAVHEACGFIRLHAEACQPLGLRFPTFARWEMTPKWRGRAVWLRSPYQGGNKLREV